MGSSPSLCTMVSNSASTVHHSCQLISMQRTRLCATTAIDWCRRVGAAHRVQSAGNGRRARRLAGSGSEPSPAYLLHAAPQLSRFAMHIGHTFSVKRARERIRGVQTYSPFGVCLVDSLKSAIPGNIEHCSHELERMRHGRGHTSGEARRTHR